MSKTTIPMRADIPHEYTWNSESVFPSLADWEAELKAVQSELPDLEAFQGKLNQSAELVADVLLLRDELIRRTDVCHMYAYMHHAVDKSDQTNATLPGKAQSLFGQVLSTAAFIEPELIAIGRSKLDEWVQAEPRLSDYEHYVDNLFRKQAHIRSAEIESLLGLLADPFSSVSTTAGMLRDADFKFSPALTSENEELEVTQGGLPRLMALGDRQARQTAWENYMDLHLAYKNTLANNLNTSLKQNVFLARARKHDTTLKATLFSDAIPEDVFHNLVETFKKNLPTWQRYFKVRKKLLGFETLQPYDIWAPLTEKQPKVSYSQAVEWICEGLAPMGEDYVNTICRGCFEDRWVDIYPNKGKTAGAFSYGSKGTHPFIVMSYSDTIFSLSTLAHELGHSMHSYLAWENQPAIYCDYSLFIAEVASNFHQAMVRAYLLEQMPDPEFQVSIIEEAMANFYRYFLIMPTLARFELEVHQRAERGEGLSADGMIDLMADLFSEAFGEAVEVPRQRVGITWATFSHLYADYYVYQYATGISGAHALSRRILSGEPGAADDYLSFLKAGGSMYPLEALKMAGVDLTFPQPVEETFQVLSEYVDRLEALLG